MGLLANCPASDEDSKGKVTTYKYVSKYIAILLCTQKPAGLA